jgi:hypothetical protein
MAAMPPAIRLDQFAELSARMAYGEKKSDALSAAKVDEGHWDQSQQFWLGKMEGEAARQRFALTNRYASLYKAAVAKLVKAAKEPKAAPRKRGEVSQQVVVHSIPLATAPPAAVPPASVSPPPSVPQPPPAAVVPPPASLGPHSSVVPPAAVPAPVPVRAYAARLTVEQLAAMRAEVATSPETDHPAVIQRFGLDASTWPLEEAHWQKRLAQDPDLFQRYLRQFQYCRSLLQRT